MTYLVSTSYLQLFQNIHILFTPARCLTANPLSLANCLYRQPLADVCQLHRSLAYQLPLASDACLSHLPIDTCQNQLYITLLHMTPVRATCTKHVVTCHLHNPLVLGRLHKATCICHLHTTLAHSINFSILDNYTIFMGC